MTQFDWHARMKPHPDETVSGDGYVVDVQEQSALLVGIDGLGHGAKAHTAAAVAIETVNAYLTASPAALLDRLHRALRQTRGAVVTVARVDLTANTITWAGIGNVTALILRVDEVDIYKIDRLVLRGGIVGFQMPAVKVFKVDFSPGDTLIMVSDGIASEFTDQLPTAHTPEQLTAHIMDNYNPGTDDATVIVARYTA